MTILNTEDCYAIWAPDGLVWSPWAKRALFAGEPGVPDDDMSIVLPPLDSVAVPDPWTPAALVVDLPGPESVFVGLALAARGFRPVPLFNGTSGPMAVVDNGPLLAALGAGAAVLQTSALKPDARPAFLLDSRRLDPIGAGEPGRYDNRWVVLPQDFPSATFLASQHITDVTVIQRGGTTPMQDLVHVLRRWQDAGMRIRGIDLATNDVRDPLDVPTPTWFRRAWYAMLAIAGLRRSNVGGFGSMVPEQTRSSGFYG